MDGAISQPKVLFLMPYFGQWPIWWSYYLQSCEANPSYHWLFITDCPPPTVPPANVSFERLSFAALREQISGRLDLKLPLPHPYKLCDLRQAYGFIFEDYLKGYDFFGYGDIDVLYGDIRISEERFGVDIISFHDKFLSGHLSLYRNTAEIRELFFKLDNWREVFLGNDYQRLDEWGVVPLLSKERLSFCESYSSPCQWIPWKDGTAHWPTEWYWSPGSVTNNFDDAAYLSFHFFDWKHRWSHWRKTKPYFHIRRESEGLRINELGFFPWNSVRRKGELTLTERLDMLRHKALSIGASYHIADGRLMKQGRPATVAEVVGDIGRRLR